MINRFISYSILKNLRFADPFLLLFLLDRGYSLTEIGLWLGAQHLCTGTLELPSGILADRFGRRRSLALCFFCYLGSFELFLMATPGAPLGLSVALLLFAVGEALRTGSHKAIMLDYLDQRGESSRVTEVVGLTRSYSRLSSGFAAIIGGLMLFYTGSYEPLFHLSALAALLGFLLMLSYPTELEGEQIRDTQPGSPRPSLLERSRLLMATPGVLGMVAQSILFESQNKLVRKYYLQPFLKQGLGLMGLPLLGVGAIAIGAVELAAEWLGAVGARYSKTFEQLSGGTSKALTLAYRGSLIGIGMIAASANFGILWPGVIAAILAWILQNARRPVFVAAFAKFMDKPQRATSLSLESLARTLTLSALLPVCGVLADQFGLWAAFTFVFSLALVGLILPQPEA